jgi:uncharacterized integral membrane protein
MTGDPYHAHPGDDPVAAPGGDSLGAGAPAGAAPAGAAPADAVTADAAPADAAPDGGRQGGSMPPAEPPLEPTPSPERTLPQHTIDRTRAGGLWVAVIAAAVVILLLLIFILQNTEQVEVALFGANPNLPLGVALLLAAVLGALGVALVGTARIVQLRHVARRHRREDRKEKRRLG